MELCKTERIAKLLEHPGVFQIQKTIAPCQLGKSGNIPTTNSSSHPTGLMQPIKRTKTFRSDESKGQKYFSSSYCHLIDLFDEVGPNTQSIVAQHCMLETLSGAERCIRLERLFVAFNRLRRFRQADKTIRAPIVDVSGNPLTSLENHPMCDELNAAGCQFPDLKGLREGVKIIRIGHSTALKSLEGLPKSVQLIECSCAPNLDLEDMPLSTLEVIRTDDEWDRLVSFAKKRLLHRDPSHGFAHAERVMTLASEMHVAKYGHSGVRLVKIAALFHDIVDHKYQQEDGAASTQEIYDFVMNVCDCNAFLAEGVCYIINNMSYSKRDSNKDDLRWLEARDLVSDADKIDALGMRGIQRAFDYSKKKHPQYTEEQLWDEVRIHCEEKLNHLIDFIVTEEGKKLAAEPQEEVLQWYRLKE